MRFGDIKNRVYDRLGEDHSAPDRYPEFLVYELLREACEQWVASVGGNIRTRTISLVADTIEYKIPDDVMTVIEVLDDTNTIPLVPIYWGELYENKRIAENSWRDMRSTRPTHYTVFGIDKIWVWPALSTVTSETVTVTYSSADLQDLDSGMTDDKEDLTLVPREYHDLLIDYIVGRLLMIHARDSEHIGDAGTFVSRWLVSLPSAAGRRGQVGNHWARTNAPTLNR